MLFVRQIIWPALAIFMPLASSSQPANYSVQLLIGMAPAGWSSKQWAAVADNMIGKTQAHVRSSSVR